MSGTGEMNCDMLQSAMKQGRALTAAERAHVESCDACLEAWLNATVTQTLDAKPETQIPQDFAARVVARLPEKLVVQAQRKRARDRARERHWGLVTAVALVAIGLLAAVVADPGMMTTVMGVIAMTIVAAEIAGIGLWLALRWQRTS